MKPIKERLDNLLVQKGLCESRTKAQSLIIAQKVIVNDKVVDKPGTKVDIKVTIRLKEQRNYVSRGAYKLLKAIESFQISIKDKTALDIGCSTGGFTQILLEHKAKRVYCVDVGSNQLDYSLRIDPRTVVMEQTNARYLTKEHINTEIDLAVIDVSFISLSLIFPAILKELAVHQVIALIKPQFEVGEGIKGFNGIVKKEEHHIQAIEKINQLIGDYPYSILGLTYSPIKGPQGNIEFLLYLEKNKDKLIKTQPDLSKRQIQETVRQAHQSLI